MKKVLTVLTCLSLSFLISGCGKPKIQTKPNPKTEYVFDGKGSSEETIYYSYNQNTCMLTEDGKNIVIYDTSGRKIHELEYSENSLILKIDYEYDKDGRIIREYQFVVFSSEEGSYYKTETTYKDKEKIEIDYTLENGKWVPQTKYESIYDDNSNLLSKTTSSCFDDSGKYKYATKDVYTYNSSNQLTISIRYNANYNGEAWDEDPAFTSTYTYDDANRLIKKYTDYTSEAVEYNFKYDSNNNLIEAISSHGSDSNLTPGEKVEYTYDSNNNKTSRIDYRYAWLLEEFVPEIKYEMTYDSNNNILSNTFSSYNEKTSEFELKEKETYAYNDLGKKIYKADYCFDVDGDKWVLKGETKVTYKTYN